VRRLGSHGLKRCAKRCREITYEQIRLVWLRARRIRQIKQNKHSLISFNVMHAYANLKAWAKSGTPIRCGNTPHEYIEPPRRGDSTVRM